MNDTIFRNWLNEKIAEECVNNLKKHGFDAHFFQTAQEAGRAVLEMVSGYQSFGFGGSSTTRSLGLIEELRASGKTVYDHWQQNLSREQDLELRLNQGRCDCFFCSANAISATGEIINVDGVGNRNNAMTFGTKKVIIAAGVNKIRPDMESALRRIKEIAAPMRAKSLNMQTPCAQTGICTDCNSPQRICRVTTILHRKPMLTDISVILINEILGF
ncbi:MAG: lactate utilization protein C [Desulfobacteraceae bacterium IS3]|nr:MAG: lactate utilization protein C [Desulfobacteraceae bacterium IS3]